MKEAFVLKKQQQGNFTEFWPQTGWYFHLLNGVWTYWNGVGGVGGLMAYLENKTKKLPDGWERWVTGSASHFDIIFVVVTEMGRLSAVMKLCYFSFLLYAVASGDNSMERPQLKWTRTACSFRNSRNAAFGILGAAQQSPV